MAKQIKEYTKLTFASTYTRTNGQPIDDTLIWSSLTDAQNYAKTDKAYVGQVITVIENGSSKVYVIDNENGDLAEVGTSAADKNRLDYLYGNYSEGLDYDLSTDQTSYIVKGIGTCSDTDIKIPPLHEGKPVTSIGTTAFYDCDSLISVVIPDSVISIGEGAFYDCSSLANATIGKNVTSIGDSAFKDCTNLTSIVIPDSVTSIGSQAFNNCDSLVSVVIPDSVTFIDAYAFYNCDSLIIYCEAASQPSGWSTDWNYSNYTVVWGISTLTKGIAATKFKGEFEGNLTGNVTGNVSGSSGSCAGNAESASKLNITSAVGSSAQPVYFTDEGIPAACTNTIPVLYSGSSTDNSQNTKLAWVRFEVDKTNAKLNIVFPTS